MFKRFDENVCFVTVMIEVVMYKVFARGGPFKQESRWTNQKPEGL